MKLKLFLFTFILISINAFSQRSESYQIESETASGLTFSFEFDQLIISDVSPQYPYIKSFNLSGVEKDYTEGKPALPVVAIPITVPDGKISVRVLVEESESYPGIYPAVFHDQNTNQLQAQNKSPLVFKEKYPQQFYELAQLGLFRDYRMMTLRVYPVQVSGNGIDFYKKFKVKIKFPASQNAPFQTNPSEIELVKKFVANKNQVALIAPKIVQNQSPPLSPPTRNTGQRIRLIVDEDGIYQVTGVDLQNAGVDISQIVPSSFRLTNRGKDVGIYLIGDNDNIFDLEDYLEFWGEANRKTFLDQYSDMYEDPFSDENVYWLEWGGTPGLRIVEENGSIVTNNPTEFNPSPFFTEKLHVEKSDHFERLGSASLDKFSHTLDLWFFDGGVRAVGKKQYPFQIIYPDSNSFDPVIVDVMLRGKSPFRHDVKVWLNNSFIGASDPGWFSQDSSRISTGKNSPIRTQDIRHGENILEIQMPTPVQSGVDIVLLNWFEVTYARQYKAYKNYIEFRRPSITYFPQIDLYQFDVEGFTRSDIEIYKKGISKIVNFDVSFDVQGNRNIYKFSFQDRILSDDIEYVALTKNMKKKPLRIEIDEPYKDEDPTLSLKDQSNSADYLIITHPLFYNSARELLDYRRSQGLDAELVNVQDIYDEFNFGIKSPLAIKKFIKYVYKFWNQTHKLKYVLLLGDSNFNYKSKSPVSADFVPTFFYQSIEFGAVATDFPYSTISGEDLLPDVFVGRLPVETNGSVSNIINKIKEYEQSSPIGPWRNQALFISGNDAQTFEFHNRQRPLFRTQNSRVLENQLPDNESAFRLNTIPDTSLSPDPNFGSTTDLIEYFDDGVKLVNFMGHGGGAIWADVKLMNLSDVDRLNNKGMYPFITSMTCFTGAFDDPGNIGLASKFVLSPDKGAIGVLGSSGLGWAYNDYAMLWSAGQYIYERTMRIGEAIARGKIHYLSSKTTYYVNDSLRTTFQYQFNDLTDDMAHQYNLIGDPYIQLVSTTSNIGLQLNTNVPQAGDTLEVNIQSPIAPADGYLEIADFNNTILNRIPLFVSTNNSTFTLPIPADFPEGPGIVRAYLSNQLQDASGMVRFGINYAVVDSVTTIPQKPDADDSVYVRLRAEDAGGINRVYVLRQNNFIDTLFATEVEPGVYQTTTPFPPTFAVETVYYSVYVENIEGNKSVFRRFRYDVFDSRPNLFIYPNTMDFSGREETQLKIILGNAGGSPSDSTLVALYNGYANFQAHTPFTQARIGVAPNDSVALKLPFPLNLSVKKYMIYAEIDPQHEQPDFNRSNNIDSSEVYPTIFNVTPALGSTYSGASSDTISTDSVFSVYFPPNSVDRPTAVKIVLEEFTAPKDQQGITPLSIKNPSHFHGVRVQLLNPDVRLLAPFKLQIDLKEALAAGNITFNDVRLYQKSSSSKPWLFSEFSFDTSAQVITANLSNSALYAPFASGDFAAPRVELTVNGRPIENRAEIPSKPVMYVVVEDESGLNFNKNKIDILLDNQELPPDKLFIPDSTERNNILGITVYPDFISGEHRLSIKVSDVNGNLTEKVWELVVNDEFGLKVYGNYPNPFKDFTIFSYFISSFVPDEFEIRIYTISGKLIKRIENDLNTINDSRGFGAKNVGYNELQWDGTDQNGVRVANGVYFALIYAKYQDKVKQEILKVAKLE